MQLDFTTMASQFIAIITALTPTWAFVFKSMKDSRKREDALIEIIRENTKAQVHHTSAIENLEKLLERQNGNSEYGKVEKVK